MAKAKAPTKSAAESASAVTSPQTPSGPSVAAPNKPTSRRRGQAVPINGSVPAEPGDASTTKQCLCGCGETVVREFKPGHDARYKSATVKAALGGDLAARAILEKRGWLKYLVKAAAVAEINAVKAERREQRQSLAPRYSGQASLDLLATMKAAAAVLKETGQYSGPDKIVITAANAVAISERVYEGLNT